MMHDKDELTLGISLHLSTNFFPPLPQDYVEPLLEAIDCYREGGDGWVFLNEDINPIPRRAQWDEEVEAWAVLPAELLENCRAWGFV